MTDGQSLALCVGTFFVGLFLAFYIAANEQWDEADECAEQHNVYRCERIFVPVGGQD